MPSSNEIARYLQKIKERSEKFSLEQKRIYTRKKRMVGRFSLKSESMLDDLLLFLQEEKRFYGGGQDLKGRKVIGYSEWLNRRARFFSKYSFEPRLHPVVNEIFEKYLKSFILATANLIQINLGLINEQILTLQKAKDDLRKEGKINRKTVRKFKALYSEEKKNLKKVEKFARIVSKKFKRINKDFEAIRKKIGDDKLIKELVNATETEKGAILVDRGLNVSDMRLQLLSSFLYLIYPAAFVAGLVLAHNKDSAMIQFLTIYSLILVPKIYSVKSPLQKMKEASENFYFLIG